MKKTFLLLLFFILTATYLLCATEKADNNPEITPLDLSFQRMAVRRFIFSNNINLCEFVPSEIVAFRSMHPPFKVSAGNYPESDTDFLPKLEGGKLLFDKSCGNRPVSIYMGGINPYATYEIEIDSFSGTEEVPETGIELTQTGLRNRVQVVCRLTGPERGVLFRLYKNNELIKETPVGNFLPENTFKLQVQLYGRSLGVFVTDENGTKYVGHITSQEHFGEVLDFRNLHTASDCTFNIHSNLKGKVKIGGARSYLSPGIGQADIRLVSYEDMSPYIDGGRLWFTFSCRGLDIAQSAQGVLSLDPSVFDIRFEGMIVFDHGDGLLRNDYASHLFFDRQAQEWRAYSCDFGGSAYQEGRSKTGLVTATSPKDPRKGFSVMKGTRVEPDHIEGHNEDPCIFYDETVKKWRLLTSAFVNNNITSRTYESDTWNGKFTPVALPIETNSTGTSIQKIGKKYYALMGGNGNLRIHSYPDLAEMGELNLKLQPHWPQPAGRVWASVVPLPAGYPFRYVLLTMDRPNFPQVTGSNWSYGALYFYGANPEDIYSEKYEF